MTANSTLHVCTYKWITPRQQSAKCHFLGRNKFSFIFCSASSWARKKSNVCRAPRRRSRRCPYMLRHASVLSSLLSSVPTPHHIIAPMAPFSVSCSPPPVHSHPRNLSLRGIGLPAILEINLRKRVLRLLFRQITSTFSSFGLLSELFNPPFTALSSYEPFYSLSSPMPSQKAVFCYCILL